MQDGAAQVSPSRRFVQLLVAAGIIGALWALSDVVLIIFFAVLLACVLRGITGFLAERTGMRDGYALAIVAILLTLAALCAAYWIVPELLREGSDLAGHLSRDWQDLRERLGLPASGNAEGGGLLDLDAIKGRLAGPVETMLGSSVGVLAGMVVVIVTSIYLAAAPELYVRGALHLVPFEKRPRLRETMLRVGGVLRHWVLGQLVDMAAVGVLAGLGMVVLGVPAPFALGILAGLLTFIPYFGAILAAVPAVLVALTISIPTALWALGVYTACHCIEGYVIAPIVQRRFVELPPALTVASMTVAGALFGLLGLALGTPLAAAGLTIVRMLYVEDMLGDHTAKGDDIMTMTQDQ